MKLYFSKGACSLVTRIIINELGLECEFESVDLKTKKTEKGKDYLSINPKGSVPALQIKNGEILTENAVVAQYLADEAKSSSLLPFIPSLERYRVLEWLNYITTELHKGFGVLFHSSISEDLKENTFIPLIKKKLSYVNAQLKHDYLLGTNFTLADAYLFVMLLWTSHFKMDLNEWPNLEKYYERLKKREAILKSLKQEGIN